MTRAACTGFAVPVAINNPTTDSADDTDDEHGTSCRCHLEVPVEPALAEDDKVAVEAENMIPEGDAVISIVAFRKK